MNPIGTPDLRIAYDAGVFHFSNKSRADKTVVLIGSCRIVPFLNALRVYNELNREPFHLICLNPVEMWRGPGCEVSDGVNEKLKDFRFGKVDYLICEHVQDCGVINTVRSSPQNIYDNLGCVPEVEIRLPNWNAMHIFDKETAMWNPEGYGRLSDDEKVEYLRVQTDEHEAKFLSHCSKSTFPDLQWWVADNWPHVRMGWSSNHPTRALLNQMSNRAFRYMGLNLTSSFLDHPLCTADIYESTGIPLTDIDRRANGWKF